jgi:aldehyde:ferredoxin oxidoreductase
MKAITATLPRFAPMFGWRNRLLRIDLSDGRIWAEETAPRVPAFLGARGLAAKIIWDEYPEPVGAFSPPNPFMVMPGALTGSRSAYSGRTNICAFSPQSLPYEWFTRASIGLDWGAELKKAGFDGLVVTGASDTPVQLLIRDDEVSILPAAELWGLDALATQEATHAAFGKEAKTLTIGQAGEHLSRIATVHTGTTSVAGQGGFGAVMGSKKLKAITVVGSETVPVAEPERLGELTRAIGDEVRDTRGRRKHLDALNQQLAAEGGGRARVYACTASCPTPCGIYIEGVQGVAMDRRWSGGQFCVSGMFRGGKSQGIYGWDLGLRGGFELNMLGNALGLNHWEILVGMVPWLRMSEQQGLLKELDGRPLAWQSSEWWVKFLHDMAYREGAGDALAEGGLRAAHILGVGEDLVRRYYTAWGYSGHWDGHAAFVNKIVYPFWLVGALHWAMDTRDPASSTHDYIQNVMYWGPLSGGTFRSGHEITWEHMMGIGERIYGRADTFDPRSGYEGKAIPAAYHAVRSIMKDTLPTDDQVFPLLFSHKTGDRYPRVLGMGGLDVDAALLRAGTGLDWDTQAFEHTAERVLNLERANTIRHWGRDRQMDERALPAFEYDENWINPEINERHALDRQAFTPVMDEYYRLRGWDASTGWPTPERLASLDLGEVYAPMAAGGQAAQERLPQLPPEEPVLDLHHYDPDRTDRLAERQAS